MKAQLNILLAKALTSRKFMVMALSVLGKILTPVAAKYNIDLSPIGNAITDYTPLIITWLVGQSAIDVASTLKAPAPATTTSSSTADTTTTNTPV